MLYERKRTFGGGAIDLTDAMFAVGANIYAGALAVSATAETAGTLDYEEQNQHFPAENTLEIWGKADGVSAANGAELSIALQSSADGVTWKTEFTVVVADSDIVKEALAYRSTIPAQAGRHMRLILTAGGEVFTGGSILAVVRPL